MVLPALLYLLALGLRVSWILAVPSKPVGDFAMYMEAATHLRMHGAFDEQFIYMPGYVLMAAGVQALGGRWLAVKLAGAALAALGAPLVAGITARLWGARAAAVAGVMYAVWPGGIAVSSVTGTDIPAAIPVAAGVWALVRARPERLTGAALLAGTFLGLGAWVRAVAVPLAPLSAGLLHARTRNWRKTLIATGLVTAAALVVLTPWALRNRARYGEAFLTDSHGGLTALVGAYPNSDGQFTRALNRAFEAVTGIPWLGEPHREADAWAYGEAKRWTRHAPAFALGLALARADKLLSNERSLLYWPLYRQGVLRAESQAFFERHRRDIEAATDVFWWWLLLGCVAAAPVALVQRRWEALGLLPLQLALAGVYVVFFAESRYHLTIAVLAFPGAAGFSVFLLDAAKRAAVRLATRASRTPRDSREGRALLAAVLTLAVVLSAWFSLMTLGTALRQKHAWVVHVCHVDGRARFCRWKPTPGGARSPLAGVWDAVGLRLRDLAVPAEATLKVELPPGRHRLRARLAVTVPAASGRRDHRLEATLALNGRMRWVKELTSHEAGADLDVPFVAERGDTELAWSVRALGADDRVSYNVWLDGLSFEKMP